MDRIIIKGGVPLEGTVEISGAKNAALPIMAAALLSDEPLELSNVPDLADVASMQRLLQSLEEALRADGCRWSMLETGAEQTEAVRLYERCGYVRRGPFGGRRVVKRVVRRGPMGRTVTTTRTVR